MSKTTLITIKPSAKGERAAMGGYKPQYDEFARCVYDCIVDDSLEEIRVADDEEIVGKLDDICYVTTSEVHAYQVKWTTVNEHITYKDFCDYLRGIVDGWRKLCVLYSNKAVVAHLLTNRECSSQDRSIVNNAGEKVGGFDDFVTVVLPKLCKGNAVPPEWNNVLLQLKTTVGLEDEEWYFFWRSFVFTYGYKQEIIDVANSSNDTRTDDIITLNRLIQQLVASPDRRVLLSKDEIIATLKWDRRLKPLYDHNLNVSASSYEPISAAIELLNTKLSNKRKGYIFLQGTPGSGKSTLLTQWAKMIPNRCIRYYAFDFTAPSSNYTNDDRRGESITFLADMVRMIETSGFKVKTKSLPSKRDYDDLKQKFYEQLNKISEDYQRTGSPTVLIVDGLDHITREYISCTQTLMRILPTPDILPEGVIIVLGSQHFNKLQLDKSIEHLYNQGEYTIAMPSFRYSEVEALALKILNVETIKSEIVDLMMDKSQGHPLYLRYILNEVLVSGYDILENIYSYRGNIETYYESVLGEHLENAGMKHFLGLLSRILGGVHQNFIKEWNIDEQVLIDFKNKLHHLFLWDCGGSEISFFHNSFRQFLIEKTAVDILDGHYNEEINRNLYHEIADFCHNSAIIPQWNEAAYRYQAGEYDEFIKLMDPDLLQEQLLNFRPVWSVMHDVNCMIGFAAKRKDVYQLTRYMLFKSQLNQMAMQDYSGITLTEELIALDNMNAAKIQIRDNKRLYCSQEYALTLSLVFRDKGEQAESNLLFELGYPEFLSHRPDEFHNKYNGIRDRIKLLKKWIYTAVYFMPIEVIDSKISSFVEYLHLSAVHDKENFDADKITVELRRSIIDSLIHRGQLKEIESYLCSHFAENIAIKYVTYRDLMLEQNKNGNQDNAIKTFDTVKNLFEQLPDKNKPYLQMAVLSYKVNESAECVEQYLKHVLWTSLGSIYLNFNDEFEVLLPHLRYEELRSYCGYDDIITELVPTDTSKADNALMEDYARMLLYLAKIKGMARKKNSSVGEFSTMISTAIAFMDSTKQMHHNFYSYTISKQREDFYKYIIDIACEFGNNYINKLLHIFREYFFKSSCNADPDEKRQTILKLYEVGADRDNCSDMLNDLGQTMMEYQDLDGRASNTYKQGKAWLILGEREKAEILFHQMIRESFGIGYRKDFQPTTIAEWIGAANMHDSKGAITRIHWMTQRLHYIDEVSESRTGSDAALQLLNDAMALNSGLGLSLATWMLDSGYSYFEAVSRILITNFLKQVRNTSEFRSVSRMYSSLHLYACNSCDTDRKLLKRVCNKGREIYGDGFGDFVQELRRCVLTQCSENQHETMLNTLDELLSSYSEPQTPITNTQMSRSICLEANELYSRDQIDAAWEKAKVALNESSPSGWFRFYDGGTRLNACKMLIKINTQKGRDIIWSLLANDMCKSECYAFMNSWDEIIPLLEDNIDVQKLFDEKFGYMNRILRDDTIVGSDKPELSFTNQGISELVFGWLTYVAQLHVLCIADKAKMLMAEMIVGDCKLASDLFKHSERLILEVGMYVRELDKTKLIYFKDIALKNATSSNYQYRVYGTAILNDLGEPLPVIPRKLLPGIYNLIIPEIKSFDFGIDKPLSSNIDWNNPSSVMGVSSHLQSYLTFVTGIEKTNIDTRAMQLMLNYGTKADWTNEADKKLGNHYQDICLSFPYRRLRAQAAIDGMMEVAAELIDAGAVNGKYDDSVFMNVDFSEIRVNEATKPEFVQRVGDVGSYSVEEKWLDKVTESPRFSIHLQDYDNCYVIGEQTWIVKPGDGMPSEVYMMKVSYDKEKPMPENFFGNSHFQSLSSHYLYHGGNSPEVIVIRNGYFTNQRATQKWIAINPVYAAKLGWKPAQEGLFAWNDSEGNRMVESVYWQCGNTHYHGTCDYEASEGWLVLATPRALETLKKVDSLFSCQIVVRSKLVDGNVQTNSCCSVNKI